MDRTKMIVIGVLMAAVATIIQSIPVFLSESFALLTLFSAIPVYTAARINPLAGVIAYAATAVLVLFASGQEALFFLFTNGVVGISQGTLSYLKLNKIPALVVSSAALTVTTTIMNLGIGMPVMGVELPGTKIVQIVMILVISAVYNFGFQAAGDVVYKNLESFGIIGEKTDDMK